MKQRRGDESLSGRRHPRIRPAPFLFLSLFLPFSFLEAADPDLQTQKSSRSNLSAATADVTIPQVRARIAHQIQVDGRLEDWPDELPTYPILTNVPAFGPTDLQGEDLTVSADLSPTFRVCYDPEENLLYLAVRVRDEALVTGSDPWSTDACEVYLSGDPAAPEFTGDIRTASAADLPVLQYVGIPGKGTYGEGAGNPALCRGRIERTRTRMAYVREGDFTTYEWALEVFDHYPDRPARLIPGSIFGFDVVVVDKDGETDTPAWICWGPALLRKYANPAALGRLVLLGDD